MTARERHILEFSSREEMKEWLAAVDRDAKRSECNLHGELIDLEVKLQAINQRLAYLELMGEDPGVHW